MKSTLFWLHHFDENRKQQRVDWSLTSNITNLEKMEIIPSLKAWQLGETSEGKQLLEITLRYSEKSHDDHLPDVMRFFIKEEQKHGENLGRYLEIIGEKRISYNWGDAIFRQVRHFNTSMEMWTIAVITIECAAQVYYQAIKDATHCPLLRSICTDILIDEAYHIDFQRERYIKIRQSKSRFMQLLGDKLFRIFYFSTALVIWIEHKNAFRAGGVHYDAFMKKMECKYVKIVHALALNQPVKCDEEMVFSK